MSTRASHHDINIELMPQLCLLASHTCMASFQFEVCWHADPLPASCMLFWGCLTEGCPASHAKMLCLHAAKP